MTFSKANASPATKTKNRVAAAPISGMCVTCLDGCLGLCEMGKSATRGREVIYPQPFGQVTAGAAKDYPIDFSHFNIQGSCVGAKGIDADSDKALFHVVDISTKIGAPGQEREMRIPFMTGAMGSTEIARVNWEGAAIASAICGSILVCGENVCGMDRNSEFRNGKVVRSPEMERRVSTFMDWFDGYGMLLVQANVEDTRLGVPEYVIEKLGVEGIEIKWGQGAKDIGGEVKLPSLERATQLKQRGYIVYPDPSDTVIQEEFKMQAFSEFERHSRLGMVDEEAFLKTVEHYRNVGAKYISLKTGAYRPADLARAVKFASEAKIDLLTVDGAGGGTGMSPWPMMNEWGVPTVYIECLLYDYLSRLAKKGEYVPSCAIAGGLVLEDQIFKAIALGAPFIKTVCIGRATLGAAMVGKANGERIRQQHADNGYDEALERTFVNVGMLREKFGEDFKRIPPAAIGMYNYYDRVATGMKQFMAGARKFRLDLVGRDDLATLTREAADISGIPFIMDIDKEEVDRILKA